MAEFQAMRKLMNPWALHLQKLGLELKCPLCLNLLKKPMLLPCNHLFCNICVPGDAQCGSECAVCNTRYDSRDTRPAPYIENIVAIYKTLDATFASTINHPLSSEQSPVSALKTALHCLKRVDGEIISGGKGRTVEQRACLNSDDNSDIGANSKFNKVAVCVRSESEDMYLNQAPVLSPESSPSFNQTKCVTTTNMANQGSRNMPVKSTAKRSVDCLLDEGKDDITPVNSKKQHISDNPSPYPSVFTKGHAEEKVSCAANRFISQCISEPAQRDHLPIAQSAKASDSSNLSGRICSFCHSSKISERSGPLNYYADGKKVNANSTMFPNVIPVHSNCIDWTPKIYFEGDTIKNLESELKRAAKLKCSSCGLKGAGLGCYHKSCSNTYHVPCAFNIEECRWNCVNFLMLCPIHNSVKFPGEKSKSKKANGLKMHPLKTVDLPVNAAESEFWKSLPNGQQEWVLCGSALSPEEKYLLAKFADMCGATCPKFWKPTVTHVIAATDEKDACTRTFKVLMGILNGRWILNMGWIKACMDANHYVNEEPYEIVSDTHGCIDGPKTGRHRFLNNEPKLFDSLTFYFNGDFSPAYKTDLLDLVRTAGGIVIENLEQLKQSPDTKMIVVYNCESSPCPNGEKSVVLKRLTEAESVAKLINSAVVRHTWILECISASKRIPYTC